MKKVIKTCQAFIVSALVLSTQIITPTTASIGLAGAALLSSNAYAANDRICLSKEGYGKYGQFMIEVKSHIDCGKLFIQSESGHTTIPFQDGQYGCEQLARWVGTHEKYGSNVCKATANAKSYLEEGRYHSEMGDDKDMKKACGLGSSTVTSCGEFAAEYAQVVDQVYDRFSGERVPVRNSCRRCAVD